MPNSLSSVWRFIKAFSTRRYTVSVKPSGIESIQEIRTTPGLPPTYLEQPAFIFPLHKRHTHWVVSIRTPVGRMSWLEHFQKVGFVCPDANMYLHKSPSLMLKSATLGLLTGINHWAVFLPVLRLEIYHMSLLVFTGLHSRKPSHIGITVALYEMGFSWWLCFVLCGTVSVICPSFHIW